MAVERGPPGYSLLYTVVHYDSDVYQTMSFYRSYEHLTPSQYKAMQLSGQIPMNAPIIASALLNQSSINPLVKNGQPAPPGPTGTPVAAAAGTEVSGCSPRSRFERHIHRTAESTHHRLQGNKDFCLLMKKSITRTGGVE